MNRYTIYCTEAQTKKSLKIGAPIKIKEPTKCNGCLYLDTIEYIPPTAEEIIGWLREKDVYVNIIHISAGYTSWIKTIKENITLSEENTGFVNSFEEATLNGIDMALEYLIQNKK